jgi:hypothetical protein
MTTYMLDTKTVSHAIKGDIPLVRQRLTGVADAQHRSVRGHAG